MDGSQLTGVSGTDSSKVSKSGDTMTGTLNLPANGLVAGTTQLVLSGGDVGIGTASPAQKLDVNGNIVATAMYYTSDRRLKKDIEDISGLEHLLRMRGVRFTWIKDGRPDVGLIAQEVEKVFPELVHTNPKTGKKSVQYGNLVAPLIEATKEMVDMIEENQRDIASLKEENQQIKADLETLKAAIESLK